MSNSYEKQMASNEPNDVEQNNSVGINNRRVQSIISSSLTKAMIILLTISLVFVIANGMIEGCRVFQGAHDMSVGSILLFFLEYFLYPFLLCIGLWCIHIKAKKDEISSVGILLIKLEMLIKVVLIGLIFIIAILATVKSENSERIIALLMSTVVLLAFFVIYLLATIKTFKLCNIVKRNEIYAHFKGMGIILTYIVLNIIIFLFSLFYILYKIVFNLSKNIDVIQEVKITRIDSIVSIILGIASMVIMIVQLINIKKAYLDK